MQGHLSGDDLAHVHDRGVAAIEMYDDEVVAVGECGIDLHYE